MIGSCPGAWSVARRGVNSLSVDSNCPYPELPVDAAAGLGCLAFFVIGMLFLVVLTIVIGWKIFEKAGRPGWESIIPIYSHWVVVVEICKKEPLWFFLEFIPIVNIVATWILCQELAKKFGKSEGFGVGLFFLGPIFAAILAFGDAEYQDGRRRRYADDYDDDYDRPRRKKKRDDDDDDDEDDRPRKKKRDDNW